MLRRLAALAAALATCACTPPPATDRPLAGVATVQQLLDALAVTDEVPTAGYDPTEWEIEKPEIRDANLPGHGESCATRDLVLLQESYGTARLDDHCNPRCPGGAAHPCWTSSYDGHATANPDDLAIDRRVALAEAARSPVVGSGPAGDAFVPAETAWSPAEKHEFYLDRANLAVVTKTAHQTKRDLDPAGWRPTTSPCAFASAYAYTKLDFQLSVDEREKAGLARMLSTCPGGYSMVPTVRLTP